MKAMVYHNYGSPDNLELQEIEMPVAKDDKVLVRVHAASVNWHDWHFLTGTPFLARIMAGLRKPKHKVLGIDVAGRVEAVGANVKQFQPGDEVFGSSSHGCFSEYACVSEAHLALKPASMTFEEVAAVPGAAFTALQGLCDKGQIQPGQNVLINGASGGVGTFAVQIAKSFGAEVTGVCSTRNLDMVRYGVIGKCTILSGIPLLTRSRNPASTGHNLLSLRRGYGILVVWKRPCCKPNSISPPPDPNSSPART